MRMTTCAIRVLAMTLTMGCSEGDESAAVDGSTDMGGQCGDTSDCASGLSCIDGVCNFQCADDADCPTGFGCTYHLVSASRMLATACSCRCGMLGLLLKSAGR